MTPQDRQKTPAWKDWKRRYDDDKRQGRRVMLGTVLLVAWIVGTLLYGSITGEIKLFNDNKCRSEDCEVE